MPISIQNPITGSDVTFTESGTYIALDTNIVSFTGSLNTYGTVDISGTIIIGSVSANVDNVYIQSGNVIIQDVIPTSTYNNNSYYNFSYIISGTATGVTGSRIGSIIQFIGVGSYVQTLTYDNDLIINVGSWS